MKTTKKLISIILSLMMVLSLIPMNCFTAYADSETNYAIVHSYMESDKETKHGYVTYDMASAPAGTTVTMTIYPNEGYHLIADSDWKIATTVSGGQDAVSLTRISNNPLTYTFVMPEGSVDLYTQVSAGVKAPLFEMDAEQHFHDADEYTVFDVTNTKYAVPNAMDKSDFYYFNHSGVFFLNEDVTLDKNLYIGTKTTICLNGYTLNLGGFTIRNESNLTIEDCTGRGIITGGSGYSGETTSIAKQGGAICNTSSGTLTVKNITIQGNTAVNYGGAMVNRGIATLNNVIIKNNSAKMGGAIMMWSGSLNIIDSTITGNTTTGGANAIYNNGGTITLSGKCIIYDNKLSNGKNHNIYLPSGKSIKVSGLSEGSNIGISMAAAGNFVLSGASADDAAYFKSDSANYDVVHTSGVLSLKAHNWLPATCMTPSTCSYCGSTSGDVDSNNHNFEQSSVEDNVFTYTCSYGCGSSYTVDKSALFASIETAKNEYLNANCYVSTEDLQNAVTTAQGVFDSETATQTDVDNAVEDIETAISNLELKTYSVTFNKIVDDETTATDTVDVKYGEMFYYFVELDENQAIYKWVMETEERDVKLNTISQDFSQVIYSDVTFNCFIDNSDTKANDTARVVFYDKANRVIAIDYVEIGSTVNMSVEAPKVAFYDFTGWELLNGDADSVTSEGVSYRATYVPKDILANKSTIVGLNGVKVNGKDSTTEFYDTMITLNGASNYAYCDADGNILQGINGNIIFAPNNSTTIYITAGVSNQASTIITGTVDELPTDAKGKLTINAQYYLPSGCTVVEAGVVISATNANPTIGAAGCQALKSSQQGSTGEYSISLTYSNGKTGAIYAVSYLTYKDADGTLNTIYCDDVQNITFGV